MSQSVVWLYAWHPALGRTNIVDSNQLKLAQYVSYVAIASTVCFVPQRGLDQLFNCMFNVLHWGEQTWSILRNLDFTIGWLRSYCEYSLLTPSLGDVSLGHLIEYWYPAFGRKDIVDYNQLQLIQYVSHAATISTVFSITRWCINRLSDCMFDTLHLVENTLLIMRNSNFAIR